MHICRLTHLEVLNLEGNPLQQRPAGSRANGPTVGEIWSAPCEGGKDGVGGAAQAGPAAGTGGSSHVEELKMRTQNLLSFLLELLVRVSCPLLWFLAQACAAGASAKQQHPCTHRSSSEAW